MQLIAKGPDIPAAALHSQEEGKLVFFCGAGISMSSGLPNFRKLVEDVRDQLGAIFTAQEEREFKAEAYDRVLGLFELETRFGVKARQKVVNRLTVGGQPASRRSPDEAYRGSAISKGTLQRISAAAPDLVGNPRFVRLREISTKAGI